MRAVITLRCRLLLFKLVSDWPSEEENTNQQLKLWRVAVTISPLLKCVLTKRVSAVVIHDIRVEEARRAHTATAAPRSASARRRTPVLLGKGLGTAAAAWLARCGASGSHLLGFAARCCLREPFWPPTAFCLPHTRLKMSNGIFVFLRGGYAV